MIIGVFNNLALASMSILAFEAGFIFLKNPPIFFIGALLILLGLVLVIITMNSKKLPDRFKS